MACIRRWVGGGGWEEEGGGGWEAEGRLHLSLGHSGAMSLVNDRSKHNPQDRQRWLLAVVWHYPHPY